MLVRNATRRSSKVSVHARHGDGFRGSFGLAAPRGWAVWFIVVASSAAHAAEPMRCGTPQLGPHAAAPSSHTARDAHLLAAGAAPVRATRDRVGLPNARSSEHFILRWGSAGDDTHADDLLADLEAAWAFDIDAREYPAPPTSDAFLFNVYIADSGDNAPPGYGYAGYFSTDDEGYPLLVFAPAAIEELERLQWITAHEFFHAIQFGMPGYTKEGEATWFWEATAEWSPAALYPDNLFLGGFTGAYAMQPFRRVSAYTAPNVGAIEEFHQYAASIFIQFITEKETGEEAVRNAWLQPDPTNQPLLALDRELRLHDSDLPTAFVGFVTANLTWDYAAGPHYRAYASNMLTLFPPEDDVRVVGDVPLMTTDDTPIAAPLVTAPERYGYNLQTFTPAAAGVYRFVLDGEGVEGVLMVERTGGNGVSPIDKVQFVGVTERDLVPADRVTLAVAANGPSADPLARFPYRTGVRQLGVADGICDPNRGNLDCPRGDLCSAGRCVAGAGGDLSDFALCDDDSACSSGFCVRGVCAVGCDAQGCATGSTCLPDAIPGGLCQPDECTADTACAAGLSCVLTSQGNQACAQSEAAQGCSTAHAPAAVLPSGLLLVALARTRRRRPSALRADAEEAVTPLPVKPHPTPHRARGLK